MASLLRQNIYRHVGSSRKWSRRFVVTAIVALAVLCKPAIVSAQSFSDVPADHWAFDHVESLAASGITGGCGAGNYCPDSPVTRAQMAVFLERAMHGGGYTPAAATGGLFADVAQGDFAADFIEQLFLDGITGGCGGMNFCPQDPVTRAQMAVFLLRASYGSSHIPPAASGELFADVDSGHWAASWVEQLAEEEITGGCGGGNFCPETAVTRAQMAVFLVRMFVRPSVSAVIGPAGGSLSIQSFIGDIINIDIPADALTEDTTIRMTALDTAPTTPFEVNRFPGVEFEPHRLVFDVPARISVTYANPIADGQATILFWAFRDDLVLPLADQNATLSGISADLNHFSTIAGEQPSVEEMEEEVTKLALLEELGWLPDPYGWWYTNDSVDALLGWSRYADVLGRGDLAAGYSDLAKGALEEGALRFLDFPVPSTPAEGALEKGALGFPGSAKPSTPCGSYTPTLERFLRKARALLGDLDSVTDRLSARLREVNTEWCCFSVSDEWSATEIADESLCDDGVNTYSASVTLYQLGNDIAVSWRSGWAAMSKSKCAVSGYGGENEELGYTYLDGSGWISGDSRSIDITASWIWLGIDPDTGAPDSCEGISQIRLDR